MTEIQNVTAPTCVTEPNACVHNWSVVCHLELLCYESSELCLRAYVHMYIGDCASVSVSVFITTGFCASVLPVFGFRV